VVPGQVEISLKAGGDPVICARASVPLNPRHEPVTLPNLDRNYRRAGGIEETAREDFRFLITDLGPLLTAPAEALDVEYKGWLEPNLATLRIES
jgi:hypothetical protein